MAGNRYFDILLLGPLLNAAILALPGGAKLPASKATWGELQDAGAKIYEYQPTMYHCKVMIVDDLWVSVGSTNFDDRSFRLNDEANMNIYDAAFAAEQVKVFAADKAKSRLMTRAEFKNRSAARKLGDNIAGALRRQL